MDNIGGKTTSPPAKAEKAFSIQSMASRSSFTSSLKSDSVRIFILGIGSPIRVFIHY